MYFAISDSEGNTVESFHEEAEAERALLAMVDECPADADELLLLAYEDDGTPAGDARLASDLRIAVWTVQTTVSFGWLEAGTDSVRPGRVVYPTLVALRDTTKYLSPWPAASQEPAGSPN
jgi:hypothetical protein